MFETNRTQPIQSQLELNYQNHPSSTQFGTKRGEKIAIDRLEIVFPVKSPTFNHNPIYHKLQSFEQNRLNLAFIIFDASYQLFSFPTHDCLFKFSPENPPFTSPHSRPSSLHYPARCILLRSTSSSSGGTFS